MSYKHVIWDWNGTLLDDVSVGVKVLNFMQRKRAICETSFEEYRKIFTFPVVKYYERAGLGENKYKFSELADEYIEKYSIEVQEASLYTDTVKVLKILNNNGITHSILTASYEVMAREQINHYSIADHFIELTGKTDYYASGKEEIAEVHIEKLGINSSDIVFVGDTMHDVKVANRIGCDYIIVSHGHQDIDFLSKGEISTAKDLNEVAQMILKR